ncbi:MAG: hypothetical protein NTV94_10965 [Planctomycetota bacterium]|nr:hypothetical protein [Planctomycetota bacterium]
MAVFLRRSVVSALMLVAAAGSLASANPATMIFANNAHAGTSGKDDVPGMPGMKFTNFNKIYGSSGSYWSTAATITGAGVTGATDQVVVIGNGLSSVSIPAREGVTPVGSSGQLLNLSGLAVPRVNGTGSWAIGFIPAAGNPGLVVRNTGGVYSTVAVGSTPSPVSGYNYGATFASASIADSGQTWFLSDGVSGSPRAAMGTDGTSRLALEATTTFDTPVPDGEGGVLRSIAFSQTAPTYHVSADGDSVLYLADIDVGAGLRSVIYNNQIVLQVGQEGPGLPGSTITAISECWLEADQSWFARAMLGANGAAIYRNRELIARIGAPITPGASETWTTITDYKGDLWGNYIVTGITTAAAASNEVAVLNGAAVIAREGDPVDLNGDGQFNDNLFIHSFRDRCFMTGEYAFYVGARMKATAAGTSSLGANVSLIRIPFEVCIADFNADGGVDGGDVEAFFLAWESAMDSADVNLDGGIDGGDIETFFIRWERGC